MKREITKSEGKWGGAEGNGPFNLVVLFEMSSQADLRMGFAHGKCIPMSREGFSLAGGLALLLLPLSEGPPTPLRFAREKWQRFLGVLCQERV